MTKYELHQLLKIADNVEKKVYMTAGNGSLRLEIDLNFRDKQLLVYTDQMEHKQFQELFFENIYKSVDEWHMEEVI